MSPLTENHALQNNEEEVQHSSKIRNFEDSFCEIIDFQAKQQITPNNNNRRCSYDWEVLTCRKTNEMQRDIRSEGDAKNINIATDFVNKKPRKPRAAMQALQEISIYDDTKENKENLLELNTTTSQTVEILKEDDIIDLSVISTPEIRPHSKIETPIDICVKEEEENKNVNSNSNLVKLVSDLRKEMTERIQDLEQEIKFHAETNKWDIFTQNANYCNQLGDGILELQESVALLMRADPFVKDYMRLKEENQQLKAMLNRNEVEK